MQAAHSVCSPPPCGEGCAHPALVVPFVLSALCKPRIRSASSPLVGEGWGGGSLLSREARALTGTPTPNPSPAGCGLARFRQIKCAQTPAGRGLSGEGSRPSMRRERASQTRGKPTFPTLPTPRGLGVRFSPANGRTPAAQMCREGVMSETTREFATAAAALVSLAEPHAVEGARRLEPRLDLRRIRSVRAHPHRRRCAASAPGSVAIPAHPRLCRRDHCHHRVRLGPRRPPRRRACRLRWSTCSPSPPCACASFSPS